MLKTWPLPRALCRHFYRADLSAAHLLAGLTDEQRAELKQRGAIVDD